MTEGAGELTGRALSPSRPLAPSAAERFRIRLPVLPIHFDRKLGYTLIWAPYIATYQLVNRYPLGEPVELTMTALDRAIPFVPELLP